MSARVDTDFRCKAAAGFTLVELVMTLLVLAILTALAIPSYERIRRRVFDTTALSDVVNAGRALAAGDERADLAVVVQGPATLPQVPALRVSAGTTLTLLRRTGSDGLPWIVVRGRHRGGSGATFYLENQRLYVERGGDGL